MKKKSITVSPLFLNLMFVVCQEYHHQTLANIISYIFVFFILLGLCMIGFVYFSVVKLKKPTTTTITTPNITYWQKARHLISSIVPAATFFYYGYNFVGSLLVVTTILWLFTNINNSFELLKDIAKAQKD